MELLAACVVAVVAMVFAALSIRAGQERTHTAWMHSVHVQDDCWARANRQAMTDAVKIKELVQASTLLTKHNTELIRQNTELSSLRLNFAAMQDHILENVRRTIAKELRPESETHAVVPCDGNEETTRITREEMRLVGSAADGNGGGAR